MSKANIIVIGSSPIIKHVAAKKDNPKSGSPVFNIWNYFDHDSGNFRVGVWDCTAGSWEHNHPQLEFCYIIEGSVEVAEKESGIFYNFETGSSFIVPKGLHVIWTVKNYVKKILVAATHLDNT